MKAGGRVEGVRCERTRMLWADTRVTQSGHAHAHGASTPARGDITQRHTRRRQGHAHMLPPRRHTRCLVHTHVRSVQECKLVSGAQALPVQAWMCSSQCMHTCGMPARPASAHVCTCTLFPTDTQSCSVHIHPNAHSAHVDTYTLSADTHVCADTRCWVSPVLMQRCVVFLLSFLPPPSSALCGGGRSLVSLSPSSWGRTSQRYRHTAPVWTVTHALSKVEIPLLCMKDACRTREQSQARLQGHSFVSRNRDVFSPAEGELLSSVPPMMHLSVGKRRGGGTGSCWLAGSTRVDIAGCSTC